MLFKVIEQGKCSTCPEQPGCCSSAQHHFSKFHFYLQESREPHVSSWRLKPLKELQGSELLYSEDGNAQLFKKKYFKSSQLFKQRYQNVFYCLDAVHLAHRKLQHRYKCVVELGANLSRFISSISAENAEKRRTMSNITLLISCISRYFHFLCSHKWGILLRPLMICPELVWQILGFEGFPGTSKALGLHWKP